MCLRTWTRVYSNYKKLMFTHMHVSWFEVYIISEIETSISIQKKCLTLTLVGIFQYRRINWINSVKYIMLDYIFSNYDPRYYQRWKRAMCQIYTEWRYVNRQSCYRICHACFSIWPFVRFSNITVLLSIYLHGSYFLSNHIYLAFMKRIKLNLMLLLSKVF
jgi:hypothetical protein